MVRIHRIDKHDSIHHCLLKVNSAGVTTLFAGTLSTLGGTGNGGPATSAKFNWPSGVAVDLLGNLFIADTYNQAIRKVWQIFLKFVVALWMCVDFEIWQVNSVGVISNAVSGLNYPRGVAVDTNMDVYVADTDNNRILKVQSLITQSNVKISHHQH